MGKSAFEEKKTDLKNKLETFLSSYIYYFFFATTFNFKNFQKLFCNHLFSVEICNSFFLSLFLRASVSISHLKIRPMHQSMSFITKGLEHTMYFSYFFFKMLCSRSYIIKKRSCDYNRIETNRIDEEWHQFPPVLPLFISCLVRFFSLLPDAFFFVCLNVCNILSIQQRKSIIMQPWYFS